MLFKKKKERVLKLNCFKFSLLKLKFYFIFVILSFACEFIFIVFDLKEFLFQLIYKKKKNCWVWFVVNVNNRQEIVTQDVVTTKERLLVKIIKEYKKNIKMKWK